MDKSKNTNIEGNDYSSDWDYIVKEDDKSTTIED